MIKRRNRVIPTAICVASFMNWAVVATATPSLASDDDEILAFQYNCQFNAFGLQGGSGDEEINRVSTTLEINGASNNTRPLCRFTYSNSANFDLTACEARVSTMRAVIGGAADGKCQINDRLPKFDGDGGGLAVICSADKKQKLAKILHAGCRNILITGGSS